MSNFFNCYRDNASAINRPLQSGWKCHCTNKDLKILFFAPRAQAAPLWKLLSAIGCSYTNYKKKTFPLSPAGTSTSAASTPGSRAVPGCPGLHLPTQSGLISLPFPTQMERHATGQTCHSDNVISRSN